jgi:Plasmid pRiA4b ORF-3-like protein
MAPSSARNPNKTVVTLRISLVDHTPTIWRRLLVPGEFKLSRLHEIFQAAMGREDYHLHSFEIDGQRYGMPDPDWEIDDIDERGVVFADVVTARTRFFCEYDFGDSWRHEVVTESGGPVPLVLKFTTCIDGQRACPPEDCGGTNGYDSLLEAIGDPSHEEHAHYVDWAGRAFDPEFFDLAVVNAAVQRVR